MSIIVNMTELEYLLAFNRERTHLSDRSIQKASKNGRIYCMKEEDKYLGFICTIYEYQYQSGKENEVITYAYTKELYRNKGVFSSLVKYIFNTTKKPVVLRVLENNPFYQEIDSCLKKLGLSNYEGFHFFTVDNADVSIWEKAKTKNHLEECCTWLKRNDYKLYNFEQIDDSIIEQIKNSPKSKFQNELDPSMLFEDSDDEKILKEMSFVVLRENELVAYIIFLKCMDNSVILQQLSTSADTNGKGAIILALTAAWEYFFKSDYSKCTFGIYPSNVASISLKKMLDGYFTVTETAVINYIKKGEKNEL